MPETSVLGLALGGRAAVDVATPGSAAGRALARLGRTGRLGFVALGTERLAGPGTGPRTDPVGAAVAAHALVPGAGWLAAATPVRDHPYNVARRALALDHLTGGRGGLAVAARDAGRPGDVDPWTGRRADPALLSDVVEVLRELWNSWPLDSLVADRATGVFARTERIRRIDHDGPYRVAGPLNTPSSRQGEPVLAWWVADPGAELDAAARAADLVVLPAGASVDAGRLRELRAAHPGTRFLARHDLAAGDADPLAALDAPRAQALDGVVLQVSEHAEDALGRLADALSAALDAGPAPRSATTLRDRLGLPVRGIDLSSRPPAVPGDPLAGQPAVSGRWPGGPSAHRTRQQEGAVRA